MIPLDFAARMIKQCFDHQQKKKITKVHYNT